MRDPHGRVCPRTRYIKTMKMKVQPFVSHGPTWTGLKRASQAIDYGVLLIDGHILFVHVRTQLGRLLSTRMLKHGRDRIQLLLYYVVVRAIPRCS